MKEKNKTSSAPEFYSFKELDKIPAVYKLVVGQRSNGKTFAYLSEKVLEDFFKLARPSAYIRRWDEDIKPSNIANLFDPQIPNLIALSNGEYNCFIYRSKCWYPVFRDENGDITKRCPDFICKAYSVNNWEHAKGQDAGNFKNIGFDEFISRGCYVPNEFACFQNLLSSIIRNRDDVNIYMIANTVSKFCPYFTEMRIDIDKVKSGEIVVYNNKAGNPFIALERCSPNKNVQSSVVKYYDFEDNIASKMITAGEWEVPQYRHMPCKYTPDMDIFTAYIEHTYKLTIKVVALYNDIMLYVYPTRKEHITTEADIVYCDRPRTPFQSVSLTDRKTKAHNLIATLISENKICFSDNDTGDKFFNFLNREYAP